MTEVQWLASSSAPVQMAKVAMRHASGRKLQLLGCAILHLVEDEYFDEALRTAITAVEAYACNDGDEMAFRTAAKNVELARQSAGEKPDGMRSGHAADAVASLFATNLRRGLPATLAWVRLIARFSDIVGETYGRYPTIRAKQCDLFREILGNPFRPWQVVGGWLDPAARIAPDGTTARVSDTALSLAETISRERAYDRLPILADALEDAGWTDPALFAHCRQQDGHVRGCWAVDLVLGRK